MGAGGRTRRADGPEHGYSLHAHQRRGERNGRPEHQLRWPRATLACGIKVFSIGITVPRRGRRCCPVYFERVAAADDKRRRLVVAVEMSSRAQRGGSRRETRSIAKT